MCIRDRSLSTDPWVSDEQRVIDVIRDSLWLFSEALGATGDPFGLYGFSSRRREHIRFHRIKGFDEKIDDRIRGRLFQDSALSAGDLSERLDEVQGEMGVSDMGEREEEAESAATGKKKP